MSKIEFKTAKPGQWLGLLGGGQLGRMFCMAAQSMGYRVLVLDPVANGPAGSVADDQVLADYMDDQGLAKLAQRCVGVTTEFENVPPWHWIRFPKAFLSAHLLSRSVWRKTVLKKKPTSQVAVYQLHPMRPFAAWLILPMILSTCCRVS